MPLPSLSPVLRHLWALRYGKLGMRPSTSMGLLRGLVSPKGFRADLQPAGLKGIAGRFTNEPLVHDFYQSQGFAPRWKRAGAELAPQVGPDPAQVGAEAGAAVGQGAKPTYMTPEWMNQTAQVLQSNPEAARKWFLGSVRGLAKKKGLNYYLVAQDPQTSSLVEGGEGLTLERAVELLRQKQAGAVGVSTDLAGLVGELLKGRKGDKGAGLIQAAKAQELLSGLEGALNPIQNGKVAEWVAPQVEQQHARKHAPELGLGEEDYRALAAILTRVKRRPVNKRVNRKGEETQGFHIPGFRLVTNPEGKIVSLYQKAAAFGLSSLPGGDFLERFKPQEEEPLEEDVQFEDFADPSDVLQYRPLTQDQLDQIRKILASHKVAEDTFTHYHQAGEPEDAEYTALVDGEKAVQAYIRVQPWSNGHFLSNFWVRKDSRGKGLGKKLLQHMVETLGDSPLYLKAEPFDGSPFDLESLVSFYKKFGFIRGREDLMRRPGDK